jgi:hypothetical protein
LKPNDSKIDLKQVQKYCNFFKIGLPYRVNWDPLKLKSKEFMMSAKERIINYFYEVVNKEHGLVRPDLTFPTIQPKVYQE